jgi:uncharacterized protein
MRMNPIDIIEKFYSPGTELYAIFMQHARLVAQKALKIARNVAHLNPDMTFIEEAAMLHDLAIFMTDTPGLCCFGKYAYICHGYLGRKILEKLGFPKHALVCERHVGVGITAEDIRHQKLPIPERDMVPASVEEQIICYADKFYSKNRNLEVREKTVENIRKSLMKKSLTIYGPAHLSRFDAWVNLFQEAKHGK